MNREKIKTRQDLREWLAMDAVHYPTQQGSFLKVLKYNLISHPSMDQRVTWAFVTALRHAEYHLNNSGLVNKVARLWYLRRLRILGYKTGFQIPTNTVGPGLTLPHYGSIVINDNCAIGRNVTLYSGVCIGWKRRGLPCPQIGDNVFIGTGTNIIGDVHIGDNVTIGQNCVIVKDIPEGSTVVAPQPRILDK